MKNKSLFTFGAFILAALVLAFFLSRSAPENTSQNVASDGMHGAQQGAPTSALLNSLVGQPMPDIKLFDKDGKAYSAADWKGKTTVLFFNEGLMCYPACWNQIAAFGADPKFNSEDVQAISVVVDPASQWQKAIAQMPELAKANTMFDVNAEASKRLGMVTTMSSMHRGQLPGHTYLIIDKNGIVRFVRDDPNMAIANDMIFGKISELR